MNFKLQVLVVTMAANLPHIEQANYPPANGAGYLFSIQNPDGAVFEVPRWMTERPDVEFYEHNDRGICRNRNHALEHARAPLVLMADDDLVYQPSGLEAVIAEYESRPDADYILWHAHSSQNRIYPPSGSLLTGWPRFYCPISVEFSFRTESFRKYGLRWNELAGIGAEVLVCGEEELLFRDMLASGMRGCFVDKIVARHPGKTTSQRLAASEEFIVTKGALLCACRGVAGGIIRLPIEARRSPVSFGRALRWLWRGYRYALNHKRLRNN